MRSERTGITRWSRTLAGAAGCGALLLGLTGCGNFFVCDKASCPATTPAASVNYAYVANSASVPGIMNGYALGAATLTAATGSPYTLNYAPSAMVVSMNNKFLYVGSNTALTGGNVTGSNGIYGYTIGTGGALNSLTNPLIAAQVAAMDVSPDGKWLIVMSINDGVNLPTLTEFAIDSAAGGLTFQQSLSYTGSSNGVVTPSGVKVAPNGTYIALALGTGGLATFSFNTTTGAIDTAENLISFASAAVGAYGVDIDSSNFLYMSTSSGVLGFAVSTAGVPGLSAVSTGATGNGPFSVLVDGTSYLYSGATTGNTSSIYGFTNKGAGSIVALSPASVTAPATVTRLALDSSKKYVLALGYGATSGLQMFSVGTTGALTLNSSMPTGTATAVPSAMALTH